MRLHLTVLLRLVVRIEQLAREQRDIPREFAQVATQGRHLTLWVLQYLRDVNGLAAAVEIFEAAKIRDVDVRLARGALEELRAVPDAVAQSARSREPSDAFARDNMLAREERRLVEIAARASTRRCSSTTPPSSRRTCGWRAWSSGWAAPSRRKRTSSASPA